MTSFVQLLYNYFVHKLNNSNYTKLSKRLASESEVTAYDYIKKSLKSKTSQRLTKITNLIIPYFREKRTGEWLISTTTIIRILCKLLENRLARLRSGE